MFFRILILDPISAFCQGYGPCIVTNFGHFRKVVIFGILGVFSKPFFAQNKANVLLESFFTCFLEFEFWTQTEHFAKAIAHAL